MVLFVFIFLYCNIDSLKPHCCLAKTAFRWYISCKSLFRPLVLNNWKSPYINMHSAMCSILTTTLTAGLWLNISAHKHVPTRFTLSSDKSIRTHPLHLPSMKSRQKWSKMDRRDTFKWQVWTLMCLLWIGWTKTHLNTRCEQGLEGQHQLSKNVVYGMFFQWTWVTEMFTVWIDQNDIKSWTLNFVKASKK